MTEYPEANRREEIIAAFLDSQGWGKATRAPLAGDASFRHYQRLQEDERRAVLMDAPPPAEDVRPFLAVAERLRGMGYSAPEIFAADEEAGLVLLEDLGDATYTRLLGKGDEALERRLYGLAVDLLVDLHGRSEEETCAGIPPYDAERFEIEHALFTDWYLPAMTDDKTPGEKAPPQARAEYLEIWRRLLDHEHKTPPVLVLRDYHVDNLMYLEDRAKVANGLAACGLLDFQDAVAGPRAYDLVSLLEDARRDIPPALVSDMKERYLAAFPGLDRESFEASYAVLGAQRHAKVIGIFTRLCLRDGKPDYLRHIPRLWRLLESGLEHPALGPMRDWFHRHVPPHMRGIPPC